MRLVTGCLLVCAALFATGCGTLLSGTNEPLTITSEPSGAEVRIDGEKRGRTPLSTSLASTENHTIEVRKDGYREEVATVTSEVNGGYVVLDVLLTGFVGIIIDAATGGWKTMSPNQIAVTLERESSATEQTDDAADPSDTTGPVSSLGPPARR
jgi:hypothetical protein